MPVDKRSTVPSLKKPWDFGSWIDAIQNAEIRLDRVDRLDSSLAQMTFYQDSWPSGGIEALEHLVTAFDAIIVETLE